MKHLPAAALEGAKPFIAYEPRLTGRVDPGAAVDPESELDLRSIRRPAYFAAPAYNEPVARAESRAYTVEFTVPRDSYERRHLHKQGTIKLRGWHLEGAGIGGDPRRRALVVMNNGGGGELTAIDDPRSPPVRADDAGRFVLNPQPDGLSEQFGMRHWRGFIGALNEAGFDVLATDRRGNGVSGGVAGFNTAEQARDMFRELDGMETGDGLRLLAPSGAVLAGRDAAGRLMAGLRATEIPVVLAGYSRGSYAVAWAMHKNFVEDCDRDVPDGACGPALGRPNIKGAILYGPNSGGLGYRAAGHDMVEAALRLEYNTNYVDSDVFANIGKWPGLMIAKGTWDYVESLEGSLAVHRRAREPKEIFVFRGPHPLATQDPETMRLAGGRMAAFAEAAVLGRPATGAHAPEDLRDLVASSPDRWKLTTAPADAPGRWAGSLGQDRAAPRRVRAARPFRSPLKHLGSSPMTAGLFDLTGRTALVTGSSRGLGRAMAEGLADAGAAVVLNGADPGRLAAAAARCAAGAGPCTKPAST